MKYILLALLTACSTIPKPTGEVTWVPSLEAKPQEQTLWCSLSSAQMLISGYGIKLEQCEIAAKITGDDCCKSLTNKCVRDSTVENIVGHYGFSSKTLPISFSTVVRRIKSGVAVAIYHYQAAGTAGASGHSVVAYGTYNQEGKDYIVVYDPIKGVQRFWDSSYVTGNLAWYRVVEIAK